MALNIPQVLAQFKHSDADTQRQYENTAKAVNPLLGFVRGTFVTLANGMLRIIPDVLINNYHATGNAQVDGNATVNGNLTCPGTSTLTNIATTKINATSAASSTGFKSDRDMGIAWSSSAVVGTRYQTKRFCQNDAASSTFSAPTLFQPQFSGSIIGVHLYSQSTASGYGQVQVYKSTTVPTSGTTPLFTTAQATMGQYYGTGFTYAKGVYPFVAGDYFSTTATFTVAGNQLVMVTLTLEYGA